MSLLWEQLQHRSRVTKFLMGLNETYETTRRHILILKPIPTIEEAFNMVAQDERQRSIKPVIKTDNVAFQTTCIPSDDSLSYMTPTEYAAAYNTHRPRGNRPLCTHCGQLGQTVNKCFKLHGYPPGFKPSSSLSIGYQGQSLPPKQSYGFAPRGQHKYAPHSGFNNQNVQKTVAHVVTVTAPTLQSTPSTTVPDINLLSSTQLQSIIQQLQSRVQVTENVASCSHASITEHGIMAEQSCSGIFLNLSTNLLFENNIFTFHHQYLSTHYYSLPRDSWIIYSGATSHVCSIFHCLLKSFRHLI